MTQNGQIISGASIFRKKLPRGFLTHLYPLHWFDTNTEGLFWFFVFVAIYIPSVLRSSLKVNPDGMELQYWPSRRVHVAWSEVDRLERRTLLGILPYDRLILNRPFPTFDRALIIIGSNREQWEKANPMFIPLSDFEGWPGGALADALRKHAPQLFISMPSAESGAVSDSSR